MQTLNLDKWLLLLLLASSSTWGITKKGIHFNKNPTVFDHQRKQERVRTVSSSQVNTFDATRYLSQRNLPSRHMRELSPSLATTASSSSSSSSSSSLMSMVLSPSWVLSGPSSHSFSHLVLGQEDSGMGMGVGMGPASFQNESLLCSEEYEDIENVRCLGDQDCEAWDRLHHHAPTSFRESLGVFWGPHRKWQCVRNKCVAHSASASLGHECYSGYDFPQCKEGLKCISNRCQRPLTAGTGPCVGDPSACVLGTQCDDVANICTEQLKEGSKCKYLASAFVTVIDEVTGYPSLLETYVTRFLDCSASFRDAADPTPLYCDYVSERCQVANLTVDGACVENYPNDGCFGYCDLESFTCQSYAQEDDYCEQTPCAPGTTCSIDLEENRARCVEKLSFSEGQDCTLNEECESGLYCSREQGLVCVPLSDRNETCSYNEQCAGLDLCVDGICTEALSLAKGESCNPINRAWGIPSCQLGLECSIDTRTCVDIQGDSCILQDQGTTCSQDPYAGDLCHCGQNGYEGMAVCDGTAQQKGVGPITTFYPKVDSCLRMVNLSLIHLDDVRLYDRYRYDHFLCCLLCQLDESEWGDPWFGTDMFRSAFGMDLQALNCSQLDSSEEDPEAGDRPLSFHKFGVRYTVEAAQGMVVCPGAPAYRGHEAIPIRLMDAPDEQDIECRYNLCGGHGYCVRLHGVDQCSCDEDYWGTHCEFSDTQRAEERQFLKDLYTSTNGEQWRDQTNWMNETCDYCLWHGLECNDNKFLIEMDLSNNRLRGRIPQSIYSPTNLRVLNLAGNFLWGEIPSELYYLAELRVLDLSDNSLEGPLSADIYYLSKLESLLLNGNQLIGPLPWSIGYLSKVHIFHIQENNFTGTLPWSLNQMTLVTSWDLSSNNFDPTASLPSPLCPHCQRSYDKCKWTQGCASDGGDVDERPCVTGYLLACSTPRSFTVKHNIKAFELVTYEQDILNRYDRALERVPEQCSYRFV